MFSDLLPTVAAWPELRRRFGKTPPLFIAAAGFEDRSVSGLQRLHDAGIRLHRCVILDYEDNALNEPNRSALIQYAKLCSDRVDVVSWNTADSALRQYCETVPDRILCDITALDRMGMFRLLGAVTQVTHDIEIIYTEAERYYPLRDFYNALTSENVTEEERFSRYQEFERSDFVYSYDCDVVELDSFRGNPEPGRPFMLISFFAFKRSRMQTVIQAIEFEKRLLFLGRPVREDLKWREDCMRIVNWDLIKSNEPHVFPIGTLDPSAMLNLLEEQVYKCGEFRRFNIVLAPLGSKMQTLGCLLFSLLHREIALVFSRPRRLYPKRFSEGARDTFLLSLSSWLKTNMTTKVK